MTVHYSITADTTLTFEDTNAANGDTFIIDNAGAGAYISGLSQTTVMTFGYGDSVTESSWGPGSTIIDRGQNTHIGINSFSSIDTSPIQIWGFYWDQGATLEQTLPGNSGAPNASGPYHLADLAATERPDGHGGTMVGANGVNIDLMYDVYIRPAQLLGTPA